MLVHDLLPARRRRGSAFGRPRPATGHPGTPTATTTAVAWLRPLLDAAATLDLDDADGWEQLRIEAVTTTARLRVGGRLPPHLVVAADDPPVLVSRMLVAAWRHATAPPPQRHHRR
jgi:hypothetical protein